jgi:hypothetical protein
MSMVRTSRDFSLTAFVRVKDVMRALGCSRSLAYELLRRAAKRTPGTGGLLRVPVLIWERFVLEVYRCGSSVVDYAGAGTSKISGAAGARPSGATRKTASSSRPAGNETPQIRITQPRAPLRRTGP